jgi:hypothetical protein
MHIECKLKLEPPQKTSWSTLVSWGNCKKYKKGQMCECLKTLAPETIVTFSNKILGQKQKTWIQPKKHWEIVEVP